MLPVLQITWLLGMIDWTPLSDFPPWTQALGWLIALLPLTPVPLVAVVQLGVLSQGSFTQVETCTAFFLLPEIANHRKMPPNLLKAGAKEVKSNPLCHNMVAIRSALVRTKSRRSATREFTFMFWIIANDCAVAMIYLSNNSS